MYIQLLRTRSFMVLWLAQVASSLAVQLFNIGVMVIIFDQTGSALQTAGVLIARSLPQILLGPVAGALVDRYQRKVVLMSVEILRALLVGVSFYIAAGSDVTVWAIYSIVAGLAITDAFYKPAQLSLIPSLVEKTLLVHANSLVSSTTYAVLAIGYGLGGVLILRLGLNAIIMINLLFYLLAALLVSQIAVARRPVAQRGKEKPIPIFHSIRDGLTYLRHHDLARSLITMEFLEHWPHGLWTAPLMLVFTTQALQVSAEYWGYQNALYFGGNLVGVALAMIYATRLAQRPGWVIIINAFLMAALTVAYALSGNLWLALIVVLLYGPPMALRDVAQDSLLQSSVNNDVLGRVYATRQTLAMFAFMISGLLFAALADLMPVRVVYLIGAALYFGTAFYAISRQSMRRAGPLIPGRESGLHSPPTSAATAATTMPIDPI